ncbi:MAG: TetR/AcrR family transcriptional regulator [Lachnospiraceae bacterium]|nr:TetR/AcrR family transcriptional regulator [Lachnospiraceae bacterium]
MGEKSKEKKKYIVEVARKVFAEKGYKNVTMKDVVEACEISRGGLYLYFDSTDTLFLEVLKEEAGRGSEDLQRGLSDAAGSLEILSLFFKEQKKEILQEKECLSLAIYEYSFAKGKKSPENLIRAQQEQGALLLEKLLEDGKAKGEIACDDVKAEVRHMLYVLEGMKILAKTVGISEKDVDAELVRLLKGVLPE